MSRSKSPLGERDGSASLEAWADLPLDEVSETAHERALLGPRRAIVGRMQELLREESVVRTKKRRWTLTLLVAAAIVLLAGGAFALRAVVSKQSPAPSATLSRPAIERALGLVPSLSSSTVPLPHAVESLPRVETSAAPVSSQKLSARTVAAEPRAIAPTASELAEQNRLFQAASSARRNGDDRGAIALYDQLLGRYPTSPLAGEAKSERARALERVGAPR